MHIIEQFSIEEKPSRISAVPPRCPLGPGLMGDLMHPPPPTYILCYFHLPLGLWT